MCIMINPTMTGIGWDSLLVSVDTPVLSLCYLCAVHPHQSKAQTRNILWNSMCCPSLLSSWNEEAWGI